MKATKSEEIFLVRTNIVHDMKLLVNDPAEKFIKELDNRLEKTKNLSGQTADCVLIRSCKLRSTETQQKYRRNN